MSADDALTILNFLDDSPTAVPGVLRQGEILVRYAQPGTAAADRIRRDAEMLLTLAPHGLPGPELLELDLGGRRVKHAFSLQRLPHPESVLGRGGLVSTDKGETEEVWQQVGVYLRRLHDLPLLAPGLPIPSPDPFRLLEALNDDQVITDRDRSWLEIWFTELQQVAGPPQSATLHGMLRPADLLLTPDRQTLLGILDWSTAQQGDAARDVVYLPLEAYGFIAEGYGGHLEAMMLAFFTRLLLDLREAAQGRLALAAVTSRMFELFWRRPQQR